MTQDPLPENQPAVGTPYAQKRLDTIAKRWDAKAHDWEQNLIDPSCHLNEDRAYVRFIEHLDSILQLKRSFCADKGVIDAGCATGLVLAKALPSFAWGIGVDISPKMIQAAQAKQIPNARFMVGDCFDLPRSCPKAAAVLSRGILLSHYGHSLAVELLQNARASLEPAGFILWDFLNALQRQSFKHTPENKAYFTPEEARAVARAGGFSTASILGEAQRRVLLLFAEY